MFPTPSGKAAPDLSRLVKFRASVAMVVNTGTTAETARHVEAGEVIEIKALLAGDLVTSFRGQILPDASSPARGRK